MTNDEAWKQYQDYTIDLSANARNLAFAAAAIAWGLKDPEAGIVAGPPRTALFFVALFFIADVLQYLLGALSTYLWIRPAEVQTFRSTGDIAGDYSKPPWVDYPSAILLYAKIAMLLCSYCALAAATAGVSVPT